MQSIRVAPLGFPGVRHLWAGQFLQARRVAGFCGGQGRPRRMRGRCWGPLAWSSGVAEEVKGEGRLCAGRLGCIFQSFRSPFSLKVLPPDVAGPEFKGKRFPGHLG